MPIAPCPPFLPGSPGSHRATWPRAVLCTALIACAAMLPSARAAADTVPSHPGPAGDWVSANGNVEVRIAPCGPAWCGTITRVLGQQSMSRPGDVMRPVDTRPAVGMSILKDFRPDMDIDGGEPPRWHGQIYNRENGKTYDCLMSLDTSGGLVLRAYVGLPLFGRTQVWHRANAPDKADETDRAEASAHGNPSAPATKEARP